MAVKGSTNSVPDKEGAEPRLERHGSIRKVLHSLVGNDSLIGYSAKMLDRPKGKHAERYTHYLREYSIISEFNTLCDHLIPGLYVIPSAKSGLVWFGVLFIRQGLYKGGVFKFNLRIPENFPDTSPPSLDFDSRVFHPSVDETTQELNITSVFSEWSKQANHLWQVLEYAHSIFHEITTRCPYNVQAAKLYESDKEEYARLVRECVEESRKSLFENSDLEDPHSLCFTPYDEPTHSPIKELLTDSKQSWREEPPRRLGLSWIEKGSLKPCSKRPNS